MFAFFYSIVLFAGAISYFPVMLFHIIKTGKYRKSLLQRLGLVSLKNIDRHKASIWFHAVSLGETKTLIPLIQAFRVSHPHWQIILTTLTETGYSRAVMIKELDHLFYLPLDFACLIRRMIKRMNLKKLVICETDFWYNLLRLAKGSGAQLCVVNGKLSQKSYQRYLKYPFFQQKILAWIDIFCVQGELYAERFKQLVNPDKVHITGNLKLCVQPTYLPLKNKQHLSKFFHLNNRPIIVAASTHHSEENLLIEILRKLLPSMPNICLVLIPRHPERFSQVEALIKASKLGYRKYTDITLSHQEAPVEASPILLINAMGVVSQFYELASLVFVGGSFNKKVGGHNIIEPMFYNMPVLFGPYLHSQPDFLDLCKQFNAGTQCEDQQKLFKEIQACLSIPNYYKTKLDHAKLLIASQQNALANTLHKLLI